MLSKTLRFPAGRYFYFVHLMLAMMFAGQTVSAQDETTLTGVVMSSSRSTVTVRATDGRYQLFTFESDARRPASLPAGTRVRVTSTAGEERAVRRASEVIVLPAEAGANDAATGVVPAEVRRLEREIERQARRYNVGVRAGVGLDPELILVGVHAQVGPFFGNDIYFRPNVEFAFGEVTALFAVNPEVVYRLPVSARDGRWAAYVGAGPGFNFVHQNFKRDGDEPGKRIDFGEFKSDIGLNILGGLRYRSGMFVELKTSVYTEVSPTLRLIVGYNF